MGTLVVEAFADRHKGRVTIGLGYELGMDFGFPIATNLSSEFSEARRRQFQRLE